MLNIYKPISMTPLQLVERLRQKYPEYIHEKLGYAGRLDPMAEGVMILLVGDENKRRKEFELLQKSYEFEIVLGIETDSYDIMGMVTSIHLNAKVDALPKYITKLVGEQRQPYPPYSSPRVNGKPLFYWAREGKLETIQTPEKRITIYDLKIMNAGTITIQELSNIAQKQIMKVTGEFRQAEILHCWQQYAAKYPKQLFPKVALLVTCSSGTYVRGIAHQIGQQIKTGAFSIRIKRTQVGDYHINDSLHLE